ncbi:hypothetical protein J0S82_011885, partial [Galemys pyrenaicus]
IRLVSKNGKSKGTAGIECRPEVDIENTLGEKYHKGNTTEETHQEVLEKANFIKMLNKLQMPTLKGKLRQSKEAGTQVGSSSTRSQPSKILFDKGRSEKTTQRHYRTHLMTIWEMIVSNWRLDPPKT